MNTLDKARLGKNAARQLRSLMNARCVITERDLDRLLTEIEEGFAQMMPEAPTPPKGRGFAPIVHDGGRQ